MGEQNDVKLTDADFSLVKKALVIAILAIARKPGGMLADQVGMKELLDRLVAPGEIKGLVDDTKAVVPSDWMDGQMLFLL